MRSRTYKLARRRHRGSAAWASETTQHPLNHKADQEALNAEANDQEDLEKDGFGWSRSKPPLIKKQLSRSLGKVKSARIVIDQQLEDTRNREEPPEEN